MNSPQPRYGKAGLATDQRSIRDYGEVELKLKLCLVEEQRRKRVNGNNHVSYES